MSSNRPTQTVISWLAMPSDANTIGTIFGGKIMERMDMTAAICARRFSNLRVATVRVQSIFYQPLHVGLVIKMLASVNRAFSSSMEVGVKVMGEDTYRNKEFHAATAYFTIVTLDERNKPAMVPKFTPKTDDEKRRWQQAGERRRENSKYGK